MRIAYSSYDKSQLSRIHFTIISLRGYHFNISLFSNGYQPVTGANFLTEKGWNMVPEITLEGLRMAFVQHWQEVRLSRFSELGFDFFYGVGRTMPNDFLIVV
jgi:hypothetical protein